MGIKTKRRRHELRSYVNDRERELIAAGAEEEAISVSEYLRLCACYIARERLGLEVYDQPELIRSLAEQTSPADA